MENVLDLKTPGVQEMGREELREVEGGMSPVPIKMSSEEWAMYSDEGLTYYGWIAGFIVGFL